MISGSITRQGFYADNKDICEISIAKASAGELPHRYREKKTIYIIIGSTRYESGVHENKHGQVWISSVLWKAANGRTKARLVDALEEVGIKKGDHTQLHVEKGQVYRLRRV